MTAVANLAADVAERVVVGAEASILDAIIGERVAMAVWRREIDRGLAGWIDALAPEQLPDRRFTAPRDAILEAVAEACVGLPDAPERAAFIKDVAAVAGGFCDAVGSPQARIRLDAVDDNACRRFHQDAVAARLLCTYRGPGTEWGYADRGETPDEIHQLPRGAVAILKGSRGGLDHRLAHRSPPIEGTGLARLLLVVDPIDWSDESVFDAP